MPHNATFAVGDICRLRGLSGVFTIHHIGLVDDQVTVWGGVRGKRMWRYVTVDALLPPRRDDHAPVQWGEAR